MAVPVQVHFEGSLGILVIDFAVQVIDTEQLQLDGGLIPHHIHLGQYRIMIGEPSLGCGEIGIYVDNVHL
ncbi:hypothetical protein D3C75_472140 [compost metagenome]